MISRIWEEFKTKEPDEKYRLCREIICCCGVFTNLKT